VQVSLTQVSGGCQVAGCEIKGVCVMCGTTHLISVEADNGDAVPADARS